jgi:predicted phosphodiesterase
MKIKFISDTHGFHRQLKIEDNIDMIIHCGDTTNYRELYKNEQEFTDFLEWYKELSIKHKLLCAGNHDFWATKKYNVEKCKEFGIIYLEHESIIIEGLNIFMSPYTPEFCSWAFNINRAKIDRYWQTIDENIDIFICHGPARGMLDLSHDKEGILEYCGDGALFKNLCRIKPKIFCSGHIHDSGGCFNYGMKKLDYPDITFLNAALVKDGAFSKGLIHQGITIDFDVETKEIKNIKL